MQKKKLLVGKYSLILLKKKKGCGIFFKHLAGYHYIKKIPHHRSVWLAYSSFPCIILMQCNYPNFNTEQNRRIWTILCFTFASNIDVHWWGFFKPDLVIQLCGYQWSENLRISSCGIHKTVQHTHRHQMSGNSGTAHICLIFLYMSKTLGFVCFLHPPPHPPKKPPCELGKMILALWMNTASLDESSFLL